jgi:hypothetical protein
MKNAKFCGLGDLKNAALPNELIHRLLFYTYPGGGGLTSEVEPEPDPSFVVGGPSASLVVSLASAFLILTLAAFIVAFILYRRR